MVRTRLAWAPAEQELRAQQYPTRADEQRHYAPWGYTSGLAQAVIDCNGIRADFRPCELYATRAHPRQPPRRTAVVGRRSSCSCRIVCDARRTCRAHHRSHDPTPHMCEYSRLKTDRDLPYGHTSHVPPRAERSSTTRRARARRCCGRCSPRAPPPAGANSICQNPERL